MPLDDTNALDKIEVDDRLKNILGINTVLTTGLSVDVVHVINNSLEQIFNEYPQLKGIVQQFNTTKDTKAAMAEFKVSYKNGVFRTLLTFNTNDMRNIDIITKIINDHVIEGIWTTKNGLNGVIRHEMAHVWEFLYTCVKYGINFTDTCVNGMIKREKVARAYAMHEIANKVVKQALKNLGMSNNEWEYLSEYASEGIEEAFAEALSDSSENALSNEIKRIVKMEY